MTCNHRTGHRGQARLSSPAASSCSHRSLSTIAEAEESVTRTQSGSVVAGNLETGVDAHFIMESIYQMPVRSDVDVAAKRKR